MIKLFDDGTYKLEASVRPSSIQDKFELIFNREYEGQKFGEARHIIDAQALSALSDYIKAAVNSFNVTGKNYGNH